MKGRLWILALLSSLPLPAHDTWLQASKPSVTAGEALHVDLTSGDGFKGLDHAVKADRLQRTVARSGGKSDALASPSAEPNALRFDLRPGEEGVATIAVELKPRLLDLDLTKADVYLDEINAPQEIRSTWATMPEPRRWRERYSKYAKTYVRVGESTDASWSEPVGAPLEFVPEIDPTALRAGDTLTFRVLRRGRPFVGFAVGIVSEGEVSRQVHITDCDGRVRAPLDRAGRWLVRGTDLQVGTEPGLEWESEFATLVLDVAPPRGE